jgi:hypothetical protein
MEHEDRKFKEVANNDFNQGAQTIQTEVASITTREIQVIDAPNTDKFMVVDIPEAYRVDAKPYIERPFYVGSVEFTTSNARYSLLTTPIKFLPGDIARSNTSLLNMFKMAAYGRPDLVLNVSLAGTITHAGCILAAILPPLPQYPTSTDVRTLINTAMSGPHAFLNANEATSVTLPVPWYCNTDLATLDMEDVATSSVDITTINGNYATLVFIVLNQLAVSTGSTTTLNIVIEACFKHFDMVVPTPRFVTWATQSGRKKKSMLNPVYEDYLEDAILKEEMQTIKRRKFTLDARKLMLLGSVASSLALIARFVVGVVAEESTAFKAESLSSGISGLFDTIASGVKRVAGDAVDAGREWVRGWTGLHNPNDPTATQRILTMNTNFHNNIDVAQYFEKLDPDATFDRITKEPLFGTDLDEMAITHITQKDQYIGTFTVSTTDIVGKLLWIRPISPFQGGYGAANAGGRICANNLELLHSLHRGWRGSLKLKIQSVMNNKQQVKLKVLKFYNPSVKVLQAYPTYASSANAPSHLLEYTQGGQSHEVDLPFLNRNDIQPCCENLDSEAIMHGLYYIYVAQPLVVSDGSPTTVQFNVYMAGGSDLTFYGYTTSNTYHEDFSLFTPIPPAVTKQLPQTNLQTEKSVLTGKVHDQPDDTLITLSEKEQFWAEDGGAYTENVTKLAARLKVDVSSDDKRDKFVSKLHVVGGRVVGYMRDKAWKGQSGKVEVMNKPQDQHPSVRRDDKSSNVTHFNRLKPNIDIRPLIRRMYKSATTSSRIERYSSIVQQIPLGSIVGELPWSWAYSPIETLSRMYYGKNCGFKVRVVVHNVSNDEPENSINMDNFVGRAYYLPQNINTLQPSRTIAAASVNAAAFSSYVSPSSLGEVPLTASVVARDLVQRSVTYEFVVPNTCFYKYLGSPEKFKNFGSSVLPVSLSTLDFGSIVFQMVNLGSKNLDLGIELFVGLTDESRMGFHTIAPPFAVYKGSNCYYLGNNTSATGTISSTLNTFVYRGGYA